VIDVHLLGGRTLSRDGIGFTSDVLISQSAPNVITFNFGLIIQTNFNQYLIFRLIFQSFMGDPVGWPTAAELKRLALPYEDLVARNMGGDSDEADSSEDSNAPAAVAAPPSLSNGTNI
jgi:hypothetical protein